MDVAIRVQAIRQFATQQMALLIDNSAVIMNRYLIVDVSLIINNFVCV